MPFASFINCRYLSESRGPNETVPFRFGSPFQYPGANILSKLIFCVMFATNCGNNVANSPEISNYSLKGIIAM